jgi:hypothetical protein
MKIEKLFDPFPPERISWRFGHVDKEKMEGRALAYIDARDVMQRLDEVCGPANWQCRYPHAGQKTVCEIGIRIDGEWIWKSNGAGDTDVESEKGALSDAFKRAAVLWGIGQYLYDIDSPWLDAQPQGRSFAVKKNPNNQVKINKALGTLSSYAMKQQLDWTEVMNELEADITDAPTIQRLTKLYADWDARRLKENWNAPYWNQIKERFTRRRHEIENPNILMAGE